MIDVFDVIFPVSSKAESGATIAGVPKRTCSNSQDLQPEGSKWFTTKQAALGCILVAQTWSVLFLVGQGFAHWSKRGQAFPGSSHPTASRRVQALPVRGAVLALLVEEAVCPPLLQHMSHDFTWWVDGTSCAGKACALMMFKRSEAIRPPGCLAVFFQEQAMSRGWGNLWYLLC